MAKRGGKSGQTRRRVRTRGIGASPTPATVGALRDAMRRIAPEWSAADWDNVGLLAGDPDWPVGQALLTIDLTPAVLDEAIAGRFDAIIAYHPPIFRAIKALLASRHTTEGLAASALANRIAIYSPHTALDCAPGGMNDAIAALCDLTDVRPFEAARPPARQAKLVTFVPPRQIDRVAEALFAAGAGRIGAYEKCSYRTSGYGTFFGTDDAHPAVGKRGRLERVDEVRIEVVCPMSGISAVVWALRAAHPYEEPAFDIYPLEPAPDASIGQGRMGRFARPTTLGALTRALTRKVAAKNPIVSGAPAAPLRTALVCVGAAGSLPLEIPGRPCGPGDVIITGEIRHHDALHYRRLGACAIGLGHWASERPGLTPLASRLRDAMPGVRFVISRQDRDPFS